MSELFSCFTEKMKHIFMEIIASLGNLPLEQRSFLFGCEDEIDMEWVLSMAGYITMEYIKYAFDYTDPEYSFLRTRRLILIQRLTNKTTIQVMSRISKI